jgi:hypothetical protein
MQQSTNDDLTEDFTNTPSSPQYNVNAYAGDNKYGMVSTTP